MILQGGLRIEMAALILLTIFIGSCGLSSSQKRKKASIPGKVNNSNASPSSSEVVETPNSQALELACFSDSSASFIVESGSTVDWIVNKNIDLPVLGSIGVEGCLLQRNIRSIENATVHLFFNKNSLNSDHALRDERIVTSFFQFGAKFESRSIINISNPDKLSMPALGEAEEYRMIGDLEIAGVSSSVTIDVIVKNLDNGMQVVGNQIKLDLVEQLGLNEQIQLLAELASPTSIEEILNINVNLTLLNPRR